MSIEKEKRWNEDKWLWEEKHDLWLLDYDKYVLGQELALRIIQIQSLRDKSGISPDDKKAEPNQHIHSLVKICDQLGLELTGLDLTRETFLNKKSHSM